MMYHGAQPSDFLNKKNKPPLSSRKSITCSLPDYRIGIFFETIDKIVLPSLCLQLVLKSCPIMPRLAFFAGVLLSALLLACKKTPEKIISINPSEFTTAQQIKIGNAFKNEIEGNPQTFDVLNTQEFPEAYQYLTVLFNTMLNTAAVKHRRDYEWNVNIVRNDTMRTAFFLPGGHFYMGAEAICPP